jgi:hypothetical protein
MNEISDEDYILFVDALMKQATADFQQASEDIQEQRYACYRYIKRGEVADLSHSELIDFLGVSTPNILELADYSNKNAQQVMEMLDVIFDEKIATADGKD